MMEYRIEERPEFHLVGRELRVKVDPESMAQIPAFWQQCFAEGLLTDFAAMTGKDRNELYGYMDNYDPAAGTFSYIVGMVLPEGAAVPAGMVVRTVPAARYFVCLARGQMPQALQEVAMASTPAVVEAGYTRITEWEFEWYPADYTEAGEGHAAYYVPIKG